MNRRYTRPNWVTIEDLNALESKIDVKLNEFKAEIKELVKASEDRLAADRKDSAERLERERRESEARLERERRDSEARQQATEARLERERKDSEARLIEERRESRRDYNTQRFWLVANFIAIVIGVGGLYLAFFNGGF